MYSSGLSVRRSGLRSRRRSSNAYVQDGDPSALGGGDHGKPRLSKASSSACTMRKARSWSGLGGVNVESTGRRRDEPAAVSPALIQEASRF